MVEVVSVWERIHCWIDDNASEFGAYLCPGATAEDLQYLESALGLSLPDDFHELYRIHNGTYERPLFNGCYFYSIDEIVVEWQNAKDDLEKYQLNQGCPDEEEETGAEETEENNGEVMAAAVQDGDGGDEEMESSLITSSVPNGISKNDASSAPIGFHDGCNRPRKVRYKWWDNLWVPFAGSGFGDTINLDLAPAKAGTYGQIIVWRRDFGSQLLANNLVQFLQGFADDLERGRYDLRCY